MIECTKHPDCIEGSVLHAHWELCEQVEAVKQDIIKSFPPAGFILWVLGLFYWVSGLFYREPKRGGP